MSDGISTSRLSAAASSTVAAGSQLPSRASAAAAVEQQVSSLRTQFPNLSLSISPAFLGKMARDPAAAAKGVEMLSGIPEAERWFEQSCRASGIELVSGGVMIDADGNMSSWSVTRSGSDGTPSASSDDAKERQKRVSGEKADDAPTAFESLWDRLAGDDAAAADSVQPGPGSVLDLTV